jgi:hypothetical protein
MPKIAISYRRADTEPIVGRIRDRLVGHYSEDAVFRDLEDIPFGADFRDYIAKVLDESEILLVVIGPRWFGRRGGQSRLADPTDPVRVEVETALGKGLPVIPILVGRTSMPKPGQLPDSLKNFAYRNGLRGRYRPRLRPSPRPTDPGDGRDLDQSSADGSRAAARACGSGGGVGGQRRRARTIAAPQLKTTRPGHSKLGRRNHRLNMPVG